MIFDKTSFLKCAYELAERIDKPTYTKYVISEKNLQDLADKFHIGTEYLDAIILGTPDLRVE